MYWLLPWRRCVRGHVEGVSMTSPWWCCWHKSFFLWTGPSTAPTAPGPERAADPERGLEAPAETGTDASPAASRCREGSPARRAGTDTTPSGPLKGNGEVCLLFRLVQKTLYYSWLMCSFINQFMDKQINLKNDLKMQNKIQFSRQNNKLVSSLR